MGVDVRRPGEDRRAVCRLCIGQGVMKTWPWIVSAMVLTACDPAWPIAQFRIVAADNRKRVPCSVALPTYREPYFPEPKTQTAFITFPLASVCENA